MSLDYTKLTVAQIKDMLIQEGRYNKEELDKMEIKGKAAWVQLHQNWTTDVPWSHAAEEWDGLKEDLDNILEDVVPPPAPPQQPVDPDTPRYGDAEWSDYVMSLFSPNELIDGKYPNVNSLRRLVEALLGEISFSGPIKVEQTMDPEHTGKAVVTYQITVDWKLGALYDGYVTVEEGYPKRTFLSVASSWIGNTDDMFAVFPESIAETRAEGRALRKALRLNVVCADELTKKDTAAVVEKQKQTIATTGEWTEEAQITDQQINTITVMCQRLGIDINKFINSGLKDYADINEVNRTAAAGMLKQLNRYQSSGDDAIEIPQNLIGD